MLEFAGRQIPTELKEIVDPKRSVLLVWDMQNDQAGGAFNKEALIRNAPPLIAAAAGRDQDRLHAPDAVFLEGRSGGLDSPRLSDQKVDHPSKLKPRRLHGSFGWDIMEPFKPAPEDIVIDKRRPSMFIGNEFETIMHNLGATTIVMIGCTTDGGVEMTVRDGHQPRLLHGHRARLRRHLYRGRPQRRAQTHRALRRRGGVERADRDLAALEIHGTRSPRRAGKFRGGDQEAAFVELRNCPAKFCPASIAVFRAEPDADVCAFLVTVAWERGDRSALSFFGDALNHAQEEVWQAALDALVAFASPESLEILRQAAPSRLRRRRRRQTISLWLEEAIQQVEFELGPFAINALTRDKKSLKNLAAAQPKGVSP